VVEFLRLHANVGQYKGQFASCFKLLAKVPMTLTNLKISVRLALGFAIVLALSVIIGAFSINRIAVVNEATKDVATNWLVATRALSAYHAAISDIRRAEALHAMANKEEQFAQAEKRIADDREKAAKALREYAATVSTAEERPYLEAIQAAEQHYFAAQPELLKVSRASDGVNDALRDAYNGTTAKSLNELLTAVEKDIEFQKVGADHSYQISQDVYASTRIAVIVLLIVSVAIGALLA
jgi:hypothetical protein